MERRGTREDEAAVNERLERGGGFGRRVGNGGGHGLGGCVAEALDGEPGASLERRRLTQQLEAHALDLGAHVQPGTALFELMDVTPLLARIHVPAKDDDKDVEGPAPGSRLALYQMLARYENVEVNLAKMASGAMGALSGVKDEVEARVRDQIAKVLDGMDIPRRDEFDAVKAMAGKVDAMLVIDRAANTLLPMV